MTAWTSGQRHMPFAIPIGLEGNQGAFSYLVCKANTRARVACIQGS